MNDKTAVPPAIMLRQLAFVMRVSRALYAAAELKLADVLAAGPMTVRGARRGSGSRSANHVAPHARPRCSRRV